MLHYYQTGRDSSSVVGVQDKVMDRLTEQFTNKPKSELYLSADGQLGLMAESAFWQITSGIAVRVQYQTFLTLDSKSIPGYMQTEGKLISTPENINDLFNHKRSSKGINIYGLIKKGDVWKGAFLEIYVLGRGGGTVAAHVVEMEYVEGIQNIPLDDPALVPEVLRFIAGKDYQLPSTFVDLSRMESGERDDTRNRLSKGAPNQMAVEAIVCELLPLAMKRIVGLSKKK